MGKIKNIRVTVTVTSQNSSFCNQGKKQGFQPLQGPYLRVIDLKFRSVCSRQCITLLCQGARRRKRKKEKKRFTLRDISLKNAPNHFLASWTLTGRQSRVLRFHEDMSKHFKHALAYHICKPTQTHSIKCQEHLHVNRAEMASNPGAHTELHGHLARRSVMVGKLY